MYHVHRFRILAEMTVRSLLVVSASVLLPPKILIHAGNTVALEPGCGHKASQQQPPNGAPSVQITVPV